MSAHKSAQTKGPKIAIIGAGLGGIAFAIALKRQLGFEDFAIYEKASEVGGTWRDNTYPGCASDVWIHFYSLSTDLNPSWNKSHGSQPEIKAYWKKLSEKYDLYPHIAFNSKVISAEWDNAAQLYHITIQDGQTGVMRSVDAQIVISAIGILEEPRYPNIRGISAFKGDMFHSARWNHNIDLRDKRVAVIGNGCSCAQFLPIISQDPSVEVVNFCRTPNWFVHAPHVPYSAFRKWTFAHLPFAMRLHRNVIMASADTLYTFFQFKSFSNWLANYFKSHMLAHAPAKYHDKMIPNFAPGCKRTILDTDYLSAMHRPNVTINWDGISEIVENGIVTAKGETIPFDVIILATGYTTDQFLLPVRGINGLSVQDYYASKGGPTAYLGTTLPGFPNFYMLSGPNTVTGHTSVIFTEEVQIDYSIQMVEPVIKGIVSSFEVTPQATDAYNEKIQGRLVNTVYTQCVSWYRKDGTGKITSPFPGPVALFWWYLRRPVWSHYKAVGAERWIRRRRLGQISKSLAAMSLVGSLIWAYTDPDSASDVIDALRDLVSPQRISGVWGSLREIVS